MNILSRIIKVINSNLSDPDSDRNLQEDFEYTKNHDTLDESQFQQNRADYDPEIAGYYANLELPYGSDLDAVRESWKRLVRKYHPDLHSTDPKKRHVANELTQGLNRAYQELENRLEKDESEQ